MDVLLRAVDAAQAELGDLRRQLEHAGRLALLGTLTATVCHEVNNLLSPTVGYAQLALRSLDGPTPDLALVRKALAKAHASGEKAGRVGRAILGLARDAPAAGGSCEVAEAVTQALAAMGREPDKDGLVTAIDVPPDLRVAVEAVQVEHVLLNLLLNARAAMLAPGGRRGTLGVRAAPDGGRVLVSVRDTGCGIAADRLDAVFEPFHTASPEPAGHCGLGLSLCRRIVARHGGRLAVESELGRGSTFRFDLPAA